MPAAWNDREGTGHSPERVLPDPVLGALTEDIRQLGRDLKRTFITWLLITDALGVAAIGLLIAILR